MWIRGDTVEGRSGGVAMGAVAMEAVAMGAVVTEAVVTEGVVTGFTEMDFVRSGLVVDEEVSLGL